MLMPAAILVLVILGAISVDSAVVLLGQRQLDNFTASAADDAASASLDPGSFYRRGVISLDPTRAEQVVALRRSASLTGVHDVDVTVSIDGNRVTVVATGTVEHVFARAIPGVEHRQIVRASSTSTARLVSSSP